MSGKQTTHHLNTVSGVDSQQRALITIDDEVTAIDGQGYELLSVLKRHIDRGILHSLY